MNEFMRRRDMIGALARCVPIQDLDKDGRVHVMKVKFPVGDGGEALFSDASPPEPVMSFEITCEEPEPHRYENLAEVYDVITDMILVEDIYCAWDSIASGSKLDPDDKNTKKFLTNIADHKIAARTRRGVGNTTIGPYRAYFGNHRYDAPFIIAPDFKDGRWAIYVQDNFSDYFARPQ